MTTNATGAGRPLPPIPNSVNTQPGGARVTTPLTFNRSAGTQAPTLTRPTDNNIHDLAAKHFISQPNIAKAKPNPVKATVSMPKPTQAGAAIATSAAGPPVVLKENFKTTPNSNTASISAPPSYGATSTQLQRLEAKVKNEQLVTRQSIEKREAYEGTLNGHPLTDQQRKELAHLSNQVKLAGYNLTKTGIEVLKEKIKLSPQPDPKLVLNLKSFEAAGKKMRADYLASSMTLLKEDIHYIKQNIKFDPRESSVKNANVLIAKYEKLDKLYKLTTATQDKLSTNTLLNARQEFLQKEIKSLQVEVKTVIRDNKLPPLPSLPTRPLPTPPLISTATSVQNTAPQIIAKMNKAEADAGAPKAAVAGSDPTGNVITPKAAEAATNAQKAVSFVKYPAMELLTTERAFQVSLQNIQSMQDKICTASREPGTASLKFSLKDNEFTKEMKPDQKTEFTRIIADVGENLKILQDFAQNNIDKFEVFKDKDDPLAFATAISKELVISDEFLHAVNVITNASKDLIVFFAENPKLENSFKNVADIKDASSGILSPVFQRFMRYGSLSTEVANNVAKAGNLGVEGYAELAPALKTNTENIYKAIDTLDKLQEYEYTTKSTQILAKTIENAQKNGGALVGTEEVRVRKNTNLQPRGWVKVKTSDAATLAIARNGLNAGINAQSEKIKYLDNEIGIIKKRIESRSNDSTKSKDISQLAKLTSNKNTCQKQIKEFESTMTTLDSSTWAKKVGRKSLEVKTEQTINETTLALNVSKPYVEAHIGVEELPPFNQERQAIIKKDFDELLTLILYFPTAISDAKTKIATAQDNLQKTRKEINTAKKNHEEPTPQLLTAEKKHLTEIVEQGETLSALSGHISTIKIELDAFDAGVKKEIAGTSFEEGFSQMEAVANKSLAEANASLNNFGALWESLMTPKGPTDNVQDTFVNVYRNIIGKIELDGKKITGESKSEQLFNMFGQQFKTASESEKRQILLMANKWLSQPSNHGGDLSNPKVRVALTSLLNQIPDQDSTLGGMRVGIEALISKALTVDSSILKEGTQSAKELLEGIASGSIKRKTEEYEKAVKAFAEDITASDFHFMSKISSAELAIGSKITPNLDILSKHGTDLAHLATYAITQQEKPEQSANVLNFFVSLQKQLMEGTDKSPPNLTGASALHNVFNISLVERVKNNKKSNVDHEQIAKSEHVFKVGGDKPNENLKNYVSQNPGTLLPVDILMGAKAKMEGVFDTKAFDLDRQIMYTLPSTLAIANGPKAKGEQSYDINAFANQITKKYDKTSSDAAGKTQFDEGKFFDENRAKINQNFPKKA